MINCCSTSCKCCDGGCKCNCCDKGLSCMKGCVSIVVKAIVAALVKKN